MISYQDIKIKDLPKLLTGYDIGEEFKENTVFRSQKGHFIHVSSRGKVMGIDELTLDILCRFIIDDRDKSKVDIWVSYKNFRQDIKSNIERYCSVKGHEEFLLHIIGSQMIEEFKSNYIDINIWGLDNEEPWYELDKIIDKWYKFVDMMDVSPSNKGYIEKLLKEKDFKNAYIPQWLEEKIKYVYSEDDNTNIWWLNKNENQKNNLCRKYNELLNSSDDIRKIRRWQSLSQKEINLIKRKEEESADSLLRSEAHLIFSV